MASERGRLARIRSFSIRDIQRFSAVVGADFAKMRAGRPRSDVSRSRSQYHLYRHCLATVGITSALRQFEFRSACPAEADPAPCRETAEWQKDGEKNHDGDGAPLPKVL